METLTSVIRFISRWTALLGGFILIVLTAITVASVSGRALATMANLHDGQGWLTPLYPLMRSIGEFFTQFGIGPIPGDFELVEVGTAFAIFAFLPWAHFNRGHASVEILANWFPDTMNLVIDVIADLMMFLIAILIAWRHWLGMLDKISYGEVTFILQFPLWWGYAASMFGAVVFVIVTAFCLLRSLVALTKGKHVERAGVAH